MSLSLFAIGFINGAPDAVDIVRLELESKSAFWFSLVKYFGNAVAVGCALEAPETYIILKRWWLLRFRQIDREETKEEKKGWIVPQAAIGLLIIVLGILGETYCEGRVSDVDAELRAHESDKITAAESDATTAKDSARESKEALEGARRELTEIEQKTGEVSEEADALRGRMGEIKNAVAFQTPRRLILRASASKIVELLKPFAGQKVELVVCDSNRHDFETMDTWGGLAEILDGDSAQGLNKPHFFGAGWNEVPTNLVIENGNCGGMGIGIGVSKKAPERTQEAAKALRDALFKTLPQSVYNHLSENDPDFTKMMLDRGYLDKGSPIAAQILDPELIIVGIDARPTQ